MSEIAIRAAAYEECAKICDANAAAWAVEAQAARDEGRAPLLYDAQHHEARALAFVIREHASRLTQAEVLK